jgi:hypothetical protein
MARFRKQAEGLLHTDYFTENYEARFQRLVSHFLVNLGRWPVDWILRDSLPGPRKELERESKVVLNHLYFYLPAAGDRPHSERLDNARQRLKFGFKFFDPLRNFS